MQDFSRTNRERTIRIFSREETGRKARENTLSGVRRGGKSEGAEA